SLAFSHACRQRSSSSSQLSNKYVDEQAPWTLYKKGDQAAVERVLYSVLESVRLAAYLLSPIIPNISNAIYQQLGFSADFNNRDINSSAPFIIHAAWGTLPANQLLGDPQPIFQRLEPPL
ncbi:class I tRNA ligase family protein, partial [bacterium]|nr:class I tRNA ligase family protein [bacterium]